MDNEKFYKDYELKFKYILVEFQNDFMSLKMKEYINLLDNEDIVSSLFKDTAKDIFDYSDIYDVDIKIIDDIKILSFLAINIYKIVENNITFTKKYYIFDIMLNRFIAHLPSNKANKILVKLQYMFKNLSSYSELITNNGRFGIFQILKSIYNSEIDFLSPKPIDLNIKQEINRKLEDDKTLEELENHLGEVSAKDWILSN